MSVGIGDYIAVTNLIIAAYRHWHGIPDEITDFMAVVQDLKTQAEALAANSLFDPQILQHSERNFLCDWSIATYSILRDFRTTYHEKDSHLTQMVRWMLSSKLKPLLKKIKIQLRSFEKFKHDLLLRSST